MKIYTIQRMCFNIFAQRWRNESFICRKKNPMRQTRKLNFVIRTENFRDILKDLKSIGWVVQLI